MTSRERKQRRIIRVQRQKVRKQKARIAGLKDRVECLEELALSESRRENLVYRIRKTIKTGILNVRTAVFLLDIMEHQISRHRRHDELKKRRQEGIDLTRQETWYLKNLFEKKEGLYYFLCTAKFLEDSMGIPKTTQFRYLKELAGISLVRTIVKKPSRGNQLRYLYIDVDEWDRLITMHEDREHQKYRNPGKW